MSVLLKVVKVLFYIFCCGSPQESSEPEEQYTPPVHQPEQHQPIPQPPPHQPISQPPPHQPSPPHYPPSPPHYPSLPQPISQPPPRQPSPPHYPPSPHRPPKYEDDNQEDKQNEYYINLRARANKEGDEMARCFSESHEAYSRGDGAAAKDLSNQGKIHKQKMEQLNKEASDWIFVENNRDSKPGEIDLHDLYVKEAIARTDTALEEAKRRGDSEIRLIVGKGLHSKGGAAKIRLAIEKRMREHQLVAELDPSNSGVLVVELNSHP